MCYIGMPIDAAQDTTALFALTFQHELAFNDYACPFMQLNWSGQVCAAGNTGSMTARLLLVVVLALMPQAFSSYFEPSEEQQPDTAAASETMAVTVVFFDEWEPGLPRRIQQVAIDGNGHGQVATRVDDVLVSLAGFNYSTQAVPAWTRNAVNALASAYLSNELEDQGLVVEGNPAALKFYFSSDEFIRVVDAEPGYPDTPGSLLTLARQMQDMAADATPSMLTENYLCVTPLGRQQSAEVFSRQAALPAVETIRPLLHGSQQSALDVPAWLAGMTADTQQQIAERLGMDAGSPFTYVEVQAGHAARLERVTAKPLDE
jgi:hypothetical protein